MTSQNFTPDGWAAHLRAHKSATKRVTPILAAQANNQAKKSSKGGKK